MPYNFTPIEQKWQQRWLQEKAFAARPAEEAGDRPKSYVLDMFPYPSGAGLHVGHVENYTATDIIARFRRMRGFNVLHPMGWDAFGLPAEQYAIKNNRHPAEFIKANVENFRRQFQMMGFSYDWDREIDTTDPEYYKWTQWIFLQLYNSYFDPVDQKAKPIEHLVQQLFNTNLLVLPDGTIELNPTQEGLESIAGEVGIGRHWSELSPEEQRDVIDSHRLAYTDEVPVNWCPALGTVLANEEVIDGRSEVGGFPVERRPMRQWMLRITAYADRLIEDLDLLQWPDSLKEMQRNWIGRSTGAEVDFELDPASLPPEAQKARVAQGSEPQPTVVGTGALDDHSTGRVDEGVGPEDRDETPAVTVFTTRPDTLYGATYMVLASEHPLVDRVTAPTHRETVDAYRAEAATKSERDRMAESKEKTGVFTGAYAINPVNEEKVPIYISDYVLMGYGTGAIMAVPAHDQRDYEFATKFNLPIKPVVKPASGELPKECAFENEGIAINSDVINDLPTQEAKERIVALLEREGTGRGTVKYKLRDWLFSRQRYWGEPFPILLDEQGNAYPLDESELPLVLPPMEDFKPTGTPEPPLSKAKDWVRVERDGKVFFRETNTMPQWAGSCWYYLRFIDPHNDERFVDPEKERYWMPVDIYVGGVEHAVLHLLYARFWHKVLYDLGHVSTPEPFMRLVNQGLILGEVEFHVFSREDGTLVSTSDLRDVGEEATAGGVVMVAYHRQTGEKVTGRRVTEEEVEKVGEGFRLRSHPDVRADARSFKMSKSRGNVANPDDLVRDYGADALRLYVMYLGPLEAQKPWNTRDIIGMSRFLNSVWRNFVGDEENNRPGRVEQTPTPEALERTMHRTIRKVTEDVEALRFNTAIAELIKLNNELGTGPIPKALAENFVLMLAPFAPHLAEEIWQRLGHEHTLMYHPWPEYDASKLAESTIELPVQVNGKLRDRITVPADADEATVLDAATSAEKVRPWVEGKPIRKKLYVPKKLVNIVVG